MKKSLLLAGLTLAAGLSLKAAPPVVSNVRAAQLAGTKNVEILYDVSDADGDALTIGVQVSGDAGQTYTIPATALSGNVGAGVISGLSRRILWNAGADWNGQLVAQAKIRVTATDGTTPAPPPGMVYIPAGVFQMGDSFHEGNSDELPVHNVDVSAFFMDKYKVTKELWQSVRAWAQSHGYSINVGSYYANGHPVQSVSWYDCVKWCNARSEMEGLTPVYYTDNPHTAVYRTGDIDITNAQALWTANGYRLPTETEREKAARGGTLGFRYPWGNTITGSNANYQASGDPFESNNPPTTPVGYYNGSQTPQGGDMVNSFGVYDIGGNVFDWCWDWYSETYYGDSNALANPKGPDTGLYRTLRGGSSFAPSSAMRIAYRNATGWVPGIQSLQTGIRCVRRL